MDKAELPQTDRVRVKVVSAAGVEIAPGIIGADPEAAQPHIEKLGWMTEEPCEALGGRLNPRIVLDDGSVLWGYESWWRPIEDDSPYKAFIYATDSKEEIYNERLSGISTDEEASEIFKELVGLVGLSGVAVALDVKVTKHDEVFELDTIYPANLEALLGPIADKDEDEHTRS